MKTSNSWLACTLAAAAMLACSLAAARSPDPASPTLAASDGAFGIGSDGVESDADKKETERNETDQNKNESDKEESGKKDPKSAGKKRASRVTAIVGGDVYTVSREVIRRGTVLVRDGKILRVGQQLEVPEGAEVIDASNKYVTPGFVALNMSRIALRTPSSRDRRAKLVDYLDPYDRDMKLALGVGITSGCVQLRSSREFFLRRSPDERFLGIDAESPAPPEDFNPDFGEVQQATCPCCGLPYGPAEPIASSSSSAAAPRKNALVKMSYGELENMLVKESAFYDVLSSQLSGALNRFNWRKQVAAARKYLQDKSAHEKAVQEGKKDRPPRKTVSDDLIRLVSKEVALRVRADRVDEIRDMIALARELDYELVLEGAVEAWLIPEELSESGTAVAITPRSRRDPLPGREGETGSSIELSGILQRAGAPFAVTALSSSISLNGLAGRDLTSLPLEAAFAVRGGCSEKTALAALTMIPARLMGVEDRIGSIDEGKDADLLVLDGPPLDYRTYVEKALVNGVVCYDRSKDRVYPVFQR